MSNEKKQTEQESLQLITSMIQKAKASYHDKGISAILWGVTIAIASLLSYLQIELNFDFPFDPFLLIIVAIVFQIYISVKESKLNKVTKHEDAAINAVWLTYGISILGLVAYINIVPNVSAQLSKQEGWEFVKHYINNTKPDEILSPFVLSSYSLFILLYAFPTLVTGITKKFVPMIVGAILAYVFFIISCFTALKFDLLLGALAAIVCWLIPGIILRRKFLKLRNNNV